MENLKVIFPSYRSKPNTGRLPGPKGRPYHLARLQSLHLNVLHVQRLKRNRPTIKSSIELHQRRPLSFHQPLTVPSRLRRRTNHIPRPPAPDLILRHVINRKPTPIARSPALRSWNVPARKTPLGPQFFHALLDDGAVDARRRPEGVPCVGAVGVCAERGQEDGYGRAGDLGAGGVVVGVGNAVFDPVVEVEVDAVGRDVEFGAPEAAVAVCGARGTRNET